MKIEQNLLAVFNIKKKRKKEKRKASEAGVSASDIDCSMEGEVVSTPPPPPGLSGEEKSIRKNIHQICKMHLLSIVGSTGC